MRKNLNQTISPLVTIGLCVLLATSCKKKEDISIMSLPVVSTIDATGVVLTTAQCGGNVTNDNGYFITQRGVCYGKKPDPTVQDSITREGDSSGAFTSKLAGLTPQTKYYFRAYAINETGISYGSTNSFTTNDSTIKDVENNVYKIVQIGAQVWMAENLKTTKYNDNTNIPLVTDNTAWSNLTTPGYCWNSNNTTYKPIYGALYNWYTINTDKLCPTGWHVPTDDEWTALIDFLGGENIAGSKLKEFGTTHWAVGAFGTNESGFTALPGGYRDNNGTFDGINNYGDWWSATEFSVSSNAYYRFMEYNSSIVGCSQIVKKLGLSVRCVRDN